MAARQEIFKYSGGYPERDAAWRVALSPGPSRLAAAWIALVTVAATAAVAGTGMPAWARAATILALIGVAIGSARRHAWRKGRGAVRFLAVDLSGRIVVESVAGPPMSGQVEKEGFVAPWLTIVRWRPDGARLSRTLVLFPDMAGEQELRRLRVLLRWGFS